LRAPTGGGKLWAGNNTRHRAEFSGDIAVDQQAQKELIERHLHAARKIMHDALKQCQDEKINPAAVAQVLGENGVMLMIRNFGPEAGKQYAKSLSEEALRMVHFYNTQNTRKAE
jgi:hypothetical protein